jgi:hypothetical protein
MWPRRAHAGLRDDAGRRPGHTVGAFLRTGGSDHPNVVQAQRPFGDPDDLLRVVTRDLPDFQQVHDNRLSTLPGVQRLSSTLVMKSITEPNALIPRSGPAGLTLGHGSGGFGCGVAGQAAGGDRGTTKGGRGGPEDTRGADADSNDPNEAGDDDLAEPVASESQ